MSISALTSLAATRNTAQPTKQSVGKAAAGAPGAQELAGMTDLLATQVPTELVAPYTAITAAIVGAVASPSAAHPHPDQLAVWRWIAFGMLVGLTVAFVWAGARRKSAHRRFPLLEIVGATVAATGWAFVLPGSPLVPYIHGQTSRTIVPLLVAFGATSLIGLTATGLQGERGKQRKKQPAGAK